MEKEELQERVNDIIASGYDDELAHSMEDKLHLEIINTFCPAWVKNEINRLSLADFDRWCA